MTIPTPDALAASCRAFALQCKPFGVSGVLNEAADLIQQQQATIERLSAALAIIERGTVDDAFGKPVKITLFRMRSIARAALGKDAK